MKTVTIILVDLSDSMKNMIYTAKKILINEIIPIIVFSDRIGVVGFWSLNKKPKFYKYQNLLLTNKEQLIKSVNNLNTKNGGTPIAASIKHSVELLSEYRAYNKRIILITDGQETDGGDYKLEAEKAKRDGIECEIHIIGLNLNQQAKQKAEQISKITGGSFSYINSTTYNNSVIKKSITNFENSIKGDIKSSTNIISPEIKKEEKSIQQNKLNSLKDKKIEKEKDTDPKIEEISKKIDRLFEILSVVDNTDEEVYIKENEELNKIIGRKTEKIIHDLLIKKYGERVKWLNELKESYSNHDFEIIDIDNSVEYFIECKGTVNDESVFYLTKEEWLFFINNTINYQLYFVKDINIETPEITKIDNLLDWLLKGKVVPYYSKNTKLKKERIPMMIVE